MAGWKRGLSHEIGGHVFGQEAVTRRHGAAPINAVGLVFQANGKALGFFLTPAERAFLAGNDDAEIILVPDANLGRAHEGLAAVAQFAIGRKMVVQLAAFEERLQMRGNVRDVQTGEIAQLHQSVGADVSAAV